MRAKRDMKLGRKCGKRLLPELARACPMTLGEERRACKCISVGELRFDLRDETALTAGFGKRQSALEISDGDRALAVGDRDRGSCREPTCFGVVTDRLC